MTYKLREPGPISSDTKIRLRNWYEAVKNGGFRYIVAMTRRCPNILELIYPAPLERPNAVLTENGLFMEAENIVDEFIMSGEFPAIALIDDVLVHGRSLSRWLDSFSHLIAVCYERKTGACDAAELQKKFSEAVTIWIFAVNDVPIFVKRDYLWKMRYDGLYPLSKWRELSYEISGAIWQGDMANTSYVISGIVADDIAQVQGDLRSWYALPDQYTSYREGSQSLYLHACAQQYEIYPTVRHYRRGKSDYFTPYVFLPKLDEAGMDRIARLLNNILRGQKQEGLCSLLHRSRQYPESHHVYYQLVQLILSQAVLTQFFSELPLVSKQIRFDIQRIAPNFGPCQKIWPLLDGLCRVTWPGDILREVCVAAQISPRVVEPPRGPVSKQTAKQVLDHMERTVYDCAIAHERSAKEKEKIYAAGGQLDVETLDATGEYEVWDFFRKTLDKEDVVRVDLLNMMVALSFLTQMMDSGDVSLKARAEGGQFYSAVRNTEMSLSIFPRRMKKFYLDFYRVTRLYWREPDFPARIRSYFENVFPQLNTKLELSPDEIDDAEWLARKIQDNKSIYDSLVEWDDLFD